ncbi:MAG TPA: hypothetical protein VGE74_06090 [Gemmata sp.]
MRPSGSTLGGPPERGPARLPLLAARILGDRPPGELVALLLPMVRRGLRTERGPVALVRWLHQRAAVPQRCEGGEPAARHLTEDLVRVLFDPPLTLGDTLADSRVHEGQAPHAS